MILKFCTALFRQETSIHYIENPRTNQRDSLRDSTYAPKVFRSLNRAIIRYL